MEFINRIEIQGIVGNSSIQKVADTRLCRFSVVTELSMSMRLSTSSAIPREGQDARS